MFVPADPLGFAGVGFQGASYYSAPNPEVGAAITWYVRDDYKTLAKQRNEAEKKLQEAGQEVPYPTYEVLKKEADEEEPSLLFVISDAEGRALRKIKKPIKAGVHRLTWDFRMNPVGPVALEAPGDRAPWDEPERGYMVPPGTYQVTLYRWQERDLTPIGSPQPLKCLPLHAAGLSPADREALRLFNDKVAALSRAISAADAHRGRLNEILPFLEAAAMSVPTLDTSGLAEVAALRARLKEINEALTGDPLLPRYEGQARMSLKGRTDLIIGSLWATTSAPTGTYRRAYDEARAAFGEVLADLRQAHDRTKALEEALERARAPYTPGRMPIWEEGLER
jgi:tetratricopeptide (TPR) repeat protein